MGKKIKKEAVSKTRGDERGWILIFYTVPSKPVKNRVKFWRRLAKAGAVQLKGAVYVLPYNEEHHEFCQWVMSEVSALGGDGDFVVTNKFEMLSNSDIISLFRIQRDADYGNLETKLNELEMKLNSLEKGSTIKNRGNLLEKFDKLQKEFDEIKRVDFFPSKAYLETEQRINGLQKMTAQFISNSDATIKNKIHIHRRLPRDYTARVWTTRKNPFVDRMASAWLIRKFIDKDAVFQFIDQNSTEGLENNPVVFDMKNGEFTHIGNQCTYEVLIKAFGIKDRTARKMAEIIHELDVKDGMYHAPEAKGIEDILTGIRKTAKNDTDALEKGIAIFEMLYSS